jgi:glycosyltransferase involved in cell wall biosynthesis
MNFINIVHIVRSPAGGIRKHILSIVDGLSEDEYKFYLITNLDFSDVEFTKYLEKKSSCEIIHLNIKKLPQLNDFRNIYLLIKLLKKRGISIVHGHGAKGGIYSRLLAKFINAKSIYTPHGGSLHSMYGFLAYIYAFIEWLMYFLTNKVVFESEYSLNMYKAKIKKNSHKYVVNLNGVKIAESNTSINFKQKTEGNEIKLASFGALRKIKGLDIAIKSIKPLIDKGLNIKYYIYGEGEEKENLKKLCEQLEIQMHVFFKGDISNSTSVMKGFYAVLQPSHHESFGYTLIEAMAEGVVVIASNTGGMKEIIVHQENGLSFESGCSLQLTNNLNDLIKNPELYKKLVEQGKKTVIEKFNEASMLKNIDRIYKELDKL